MSKTSRSLANATAAGIAVAELGDLVNLWTLQTLLHPVLLLAAAYVLLVHGRRSAAV